MPVRSRQNLHLQNLAHDGRCQPTSDEAGVTEWSIGYNLGGDVKACPECTFLLHCPRGMGGSWVLLKPDSRVDHFFLLGLLIMPRKPSLRVMPEFRLFDKPRTTNGVLPGNHVSCDSFSIEVVRDRTGTGRTANTENRSHVEFPRPIPSNQEPQQGRAMTIRALQAPPTER